MILQGVDSLQIAMSYYFPIEAFVKAAIDFTIALYNENIKK